MQFFDIGNIAFKLQGYPISYVELIATFFGLLSIFYASKANILTWLTGIVNELFLFILFFQIQLYPDMFLQIYFFIVTIYGWYHWKKGTADNAISKTSVRGKMLLATIILVGTVISGNLFKHIHTWFPEYFKIKAAYPFIDSYIMISSILATFLLAKKKIENWYLWISVDFVCVALYAKKAVFFLSFEYVIFLGLASFGLYNWKKHLKNE
jgi:nicotinamide mononucleotide transporter